MGGKAASDLGARLPPVRPKELTAVLSSFLSHGECLTDIVKVPARRGGLNGANMAERMSIQSWLITMTP